MNILAQQLNETLEGSAAYGFLSSLGRRMYFPKGIVAQSDEAKEKAKTYNATVGLATKDGVPMHLEDIMSMFREGALTPAEVFNYAPGGGDKELRRIWKDEMVRKNPSLKNARTSQCLVTAGLTHAISMVSQLFFDEGCSLVLPDLFWDNYELIFHDMRGGELHTFPFFRDGRFNVEGMKEALMNEGDHVRLLLNFPNNPTGYTPSSGEMDRIVDALVEVAESGHKLMVLCDDAYFGLFFEQETAKESLFARLADAHENIFAIKGDAATKEDMVWGFRVGFLTYASKGLDEAQLDALVKKTLGMIRCTVSNCDRPGQSLLLHAYKEGRSVAEDKARTFDEMDRRYRAVRRAVSQHASCHVIEPYPFNSGYFMAFDTKGHDAEELRRHLLDSRGIGTVNIMGTTLRVAYCSVEEDKLEDLVNQIYHAAEELWS